MALSIVFAALEKSMRELVVRIAEGEGLDAEELIEKYLGAGVPKKRAAKVIVSDTGPDSRVGVTVTVTKCGATTAKGKPCSLKAIGGTCYCRVHANKAGEDTGSASVGPVKKKPTRDVKGKGKATAPIDDDEDEAGPSAPPPPKKKKKVRGPPPVHTHAVDEEVHEDCELCHTHGSAFDGDEAAGDEFELVASPRRTLRERIMTAVMTEEEDYAEE